MADRLYSLFPDRNDTLKALVEALNSDSDFTFLSHEVRSGRESFVVTTPRFRVRFFPDRNHASTVILTGAETNQPDRWASDKKKGAPCRLTWSTELLRPTGMRDEVLSASRQASDAHIQSTPFWKFWSDLLDKEQAKIDSLKSFPGWAYRRRRIGLEGEIEFETDDVDAILIRCSGSFLVSQARSEQGEKRDRLIPFQANAGRTQGWLSGTARGETDISQIPKQGVIQLDWISPAAELKRRRTTLDRLLKGQAALPGLKDMLPNGPSEPREPLSFVAQLKDSYNEDQQDAISKALAADTLTCILDHLEQARPQ